MNRAMNRVQLAALNGSETAIVTLGVYEPVNHVSMVSSVKGTGNRPPTAKETMKARESDCE